MLRIGIDIDDTICDTNELIVQEADKYDKYVLGGNGIKDPKAYEFTKMMGWGPDGKGKFFADRLEYIMNNTKIKPYAKEIINKLYDEGNEIIFISLRKDKYLSDPYKISYNWLVKNEIKFHKLFVNTGEKTDECVENNIDIFIDDLPKNCEDVSKAGIEVLLFTNGYNLDEKRFIRKNNWLEIYDYLKGEFNNE